MPAFDHFGFQLTWLVGSSPKLQWLCKYIKEVVLDLDEKVVIYADWPLTVFLVELIIVTMGIKGGSIRAGLKRAARLQNEYDYNHDPEFKVLICSSRSAAESLNLQRGGHRMVVMDVVSANTLIQIIGRLCRIGQKHVQDISVLTVDETYDQVLIYECQKVFRLQVAATAEVPDDAAHKFLRNLDQQQETEMKEATKTSTITDAQFLWAKQQLREPYVDYLTRGQFGFRSNKTAAWGANDLEKKSLEPEEFLFRMAFGGVVAQQAYTLMSRREEKLTKPHKKPAQVYDDIFDDPLELDEEGELEPVAPAKNDYMTFNPPYKLPEDLELVDEVRAVAYILRAARKLTTQVEYRAGGLNVDSKYAPITSTRKEVPTVTFFRRSGDVSVKAPPSGTVCSRKKEYRPRLSFSSCC
jgi:hypothetical protein